MDAHATCLALQHGRITTGKVMHCNLFFVAASGATSLLAFMYPALWLHSFLLLISIFWARSTTRITAGLVLAVFAAGMSRGLPVAAEAFYGTSTAFWWGIAVYLLQCLLFFMLGFICWHPNQRNRIPRTTLLVLLWTLPPFGFIGWGNPLLAAGWLFPDWGWFGLIALLLTMMLIAWRIHFIALPLFLLAINQNHQLPQATGWQSHHTQYQFGAESQKRGLTAEYLRHRDMGTQLHSTNYPVSVHLFPETVGGKWNPMASLYWQRQLQRVDKNAHNHNRPNHQTTVLIGASTREAGNRYNSVLAITAEQAQTIYRQRVPVPGVMWNPLLDNAYSSDQKQTPVSIINGRRTAFLVCYEALLALPILQSLLHQPKHLAVIASVWWAPDYVIRAQQAAAHSWARLFGLSLSEAYNR